MRAVDPFEVELGELARLVVAAGVAVRCQRSAALERRAHLVGLASRGTPRTSYGLSPPPPPPPPPPSPPPASPASSPPPHAATPRRRPRWQAAAPPRSRLVRGRGVREYGGRRHGETARSRRARAPRRDRRALRRERRGGRAWARLPRRGRQLDAPSASSAAVYSASAWWKFPAAYSALPRSLARIATRSPRRARATAAASASAAIAHRGAPPPRRLTSRASSAVGDGEIGVGKRTRASSASQRLPRASRRLERADDEARPAPSACSRAPRAMPDRAPRRFGRRATAPPIARSRIAACSPSRGPRPPRRDARRRRRAATRAVGGRRPPRRARAPAAGARPAARRCSAVRSVERAKHHQHRPARSRAFAWVASARSAACSRVSASAGRGGSAASRHTRGLLSSTALSGRSTARARPPRAAGMSPRPYAALPRCR